MSISYNLPFVKFSQLLLLFFLTTYRVIYYNTLWIKNNKEFDMKITLTATCLFGLEKQLGEEIEALGYKKTETIDGRVSFSADIDAIAKCNISLRLAERIYIRLGQFRATSFSELFDGTKSIAWEQWIGKNDAFPVKGHSIKSKLFSVPDCQKIIKKAIAQRLEDEYNISWFKEEGVKYQVEFFILKDMATLMIDTSGVPLHKRGYRTEANAAPLRETLAAALALTSRPRENVLLWDPFAGSGTIAIEAAMIMAGISPGLHRSFASESFSQIPKKTWDNQRELAFSKIKKTSFCAYASDIDDNCIKIAEANAARAGVSDILHIFKYDARKIKKPDVRGSIVTNPPYGERLMTETEVQALYRDIGATFRALAPWQIYVLSSVENFERLYGKRADKVKKLYIGMIPCYLYQFFKQERK